MSRLPSNSAQLYQFALIIILFAIVLPDLTDLGRRFANVINDLLQTWLPA